MLLVSLSSYWRRLTATLALAICCASPSVSAQSAENVAVVINENSGESREIGEYYARKRALPPSNVLRIRASAEETIDRSAYSSTIELPIAASISREGLQDRLLYLVLTKGVPLRISGTSGPDGTGSSVDSELTLLYRKMTGISNLPVAGRIDNPYFLGARDAREARSFTHRDHDIFLVSRLDAFTAWQALEVVDKGSAPVTDGRIVLDQQDGLVNRTGEEWLKNAADRLTAQGRGDQVLLETTVKGARGVRPVLGYYSWGSSDPQNRVRKVDMGFAPGALAATFDSASARTFREPPADWVPGDPADPVHSFAGSSQSLIGDLIREGATGVAGQVAEIDLQSAIRPEVLFPAYLSGFNLIESFYLAMPYLSWQSVVIGDPLCAPFARESLSRSDIDDGLDPSTSLPALFSKRRLAHAAGSLPGVPERAVVLALLSEALMVRGDLAGARRALEATTEIAPDLAPAQLQLALLLAQAGQHDAAIDRYRQVIKLEPKHAMALNNLAYALAVYKGSLDEALALAQLAGTIQPTNPAILDTLAWIEHLRGNDAIAVKLVPIAVRGAPDNPDMRLHAALIYAATGQSAEALVQLDEAIRLNPSLAKTEPVVQLRQQLKRAR